MNDITAPGGFCAPISTYYDDLWVRRGGIPYPDRPNLPDWNLVVAPRLTRSIDVANEARRRLRAAWRALTTTSREYEDDD